MVFTIYIYKREVEQYTGKGNIILMEDRVPFYIANAIKALYKYNDI